MAKGFGAPKQQTKGTADNAPCPCGSGAPYESCCGPYHRGGAASVPSPEALLRSRYAAYAAKEPAYIAETTHPDAPEYTGSRASYISVIKSTMRRLDPTGLTVLASEPGADGNPNEAFITFRIKRRVKDPDSTGKASEEEELTERSRFVRLNGRWLYMDSEFPEGEQGKEKEKAAPQQPESAPKGMGFKLPFF